MVWVIQELWAGLLAPVCLVVPYFPVVWLSEQHSDGCPRLSADLTEVESGSASLCLSLFKEY